MKIDSFKNEYNKNDKNYFYTFLYTQPFNNHPFLIFGNLKERHFNISIPFGDKIGQINISFFHKVLPYFKRNELIVSSILLNRTIYIRNYNLIHNKRYSIYNCDKMTPCKKKIRELNNYKIPSKQKQEYKKQIENYYKKKGIELIKKYYKLLEKYEFNEAYEFLKGDKGKYKGKTRLNTFFTNNKEVIGHLEIFISLYKLKKNLEKYL